MKKSIIKKCKLGVLLMVMCMLVCGITAFAETSQFEFYIEPTKFDSDLATKADDEQNAYITPTYINGSGRVWAAVYDKNGGTQLTGDVPIVPGATYRHVVGYIIRAYPNVTYRLLAGDSEWEVTSNVFVVQGRWTP